MPNSGLTLCSIFQRYNSKAIHNRDSAPEMVMDVVLNISKIQFKSNSQQYHQLGWHPVCCAQYFKDTIQKQFTTSEPVRTFFARLCSIFQRYNSKAIHNLLIGVAMYSAVVLNISKIQFKSNSQQRLAAISDIACCAQYFKDTIQKQFTTVQLTVIQSMKLCSIFQRYNSKAIHNMLSSGSSSSLVVLNISKIQFKSNSQQGLTRCLLTPGCAQYFKDTIQKQFTTICRLHRLLVLLCSIFQRYNSKAIHNMQPVKEYKLRVVLNISKIQFKSNSQLLS